MRRRIININEEKCDGCGACVQACHEGAIEMINGKAKLTKEEYCDGLGDCLPACHADAIEFMDVEVHTQGKDTETKKQKQNVRIPCGCPGSSPDIIRRDTASAVYMNKPTVSQLQQWPCQIRLVPVHAPYFEGANLLIAADCTAYAYGNFHNDFIRNHITLIGCPKLDEGGWADKLTAILANNNIKSVKIVRMEVPCCSGIENATKQALRDSGKFIPWQVVVISTDGRILE